jgi:hypothetical protein
METKLYVHDFGVSESIDSNIPVRRIAHQGDRGKDAVP